jgi:hypothetical protein
MDTKQFGAKEYVAIGHITDVKSYLRAAQIIDGAEDNRDSLSAPIYFLLCHGIELVLKAYILAAGGTDAELRPRKIRHQLGELRNRAIGLGYIPSEKVSAVIDMLAPYHAAHSFRYRDPGIKSYPSTGNVIQSLEAMLVQIEPIVTKNLLALIQKNKAASLPDRP